MIKKCLAFLLLIAALPYDQFSLGTLQATLKLNHFLFLAARVETLVNEYLLVILGRIFASLAKPGAFVILSLFLLVFDRVLESLVLICHLHCVCNLRNGDTRTATLLRRASF